MRSLAAAERLASDESPGLLRRAREAARHAEQLQPEAVRIRDDPEAPGGSLFRSSRRATAARSYSRSNAHRDR
jgi:hypothetical protein